MEAAEADRLNAKYSEFYLTRYVPITGRIIQIGGPRSTIHEALAAAAKIDNRGRSKRSHLTFVDVVKPSKE